MGAAMSRALWLLTRIAVSNEQASTGRTPSWEYIDGSSIVN